jgi:hypothetical protein
MQEGDKTQQEGQFQFRGQGQRGPPPPQQRPPPPQPPPPPPGRQGPVQGTTHYGANVQSDYKPYGKKADEEEQGINFEPDHTAQMRKEHQERRNKIIIACVLVAILIIIFAVIGLIIFAVLTYEKTATLEGVEASPDFSHNKWDVTGYVKNLGDDAKSLKDFKIDVGGSATQNSDSSNLADIQHPVSESGGGMLGGGNRIGFYKEAPLHEPGDATTKVVLVKLYYEDDLVETVEIDVSGYFGG